MTLGKWLAGIFATVISGAMLWAVTTYGSHYFAPTTPQPSYPPVGGKTGDTAPTGEQSSEPAQPGVARVECEAHPDYVKRGDATEFAVRVTSDGKPVANADVELAAGGGEFVNSPSVTTGSGSTNANGIFRMYWKAPLNAAPGYGMAATAKLPDGQSSQVTCPTVKIAN